MRQKIKRKWFWGIAFVLAAAGCTFLIFFLYTGHVKRTIQIVDTPAELLPEEFIEWEENGSLVRSGNHSYLMGRKCFLNSGIFGDVYYIPVVDFRFTDLRSGNAEWYCWVSVYRITMKDGKIIDNSRLEGNQLEMELVMDTGGGADLLMFYAQTDENGAQIREVYEPHTHKMRYRVDYPLAKASQENTEFYAFELRLWRIKEHIRELPYQGTMEVACSIGKQRIEEKLSFEYVVPSVQKLSLGKSFGNGY